MNIWSSGKTVQKKRILGNTLIHFNSMEPIKEFENMLKNGTVKRKVGRPPKKRILSVNYVSILLLILYLTAAVSGKNISGIFKFCDHTNSLNVLLDVENSCNDNSKQNKNILYTNQTKLTLLIKSKHLIHGLGYQCKKEVIETTFWMSFWGFKFSTTRTVASQLSGADCQYMLTRKTCDGVTMACEGENCYVTKEPIPNYSWFEPTVKHGLKCSLTTRVINGDDLNTNLFSSTTHSCKALDGECLLHDSDIILDKNIIHKFQYEVFP